MADPEERDTQKADVETILTEFDAREDMLAAFCDKTRGLIEASLKEAKVRYHSVQVRVKSRKKLREKYLEPEKNYKKLDDITDLAGLRIITYYEDDIDRVAEVIRQEFEVDPENTVDLRETEPDRFHYSALHCVCNHLKRRRADVEYKRFGDTSCEIQITSILRHAWSEIEHEWYDLKEAYPNKVKKRFSRLAALLDLAESEFLDLRKSRTEYERSMAVRVEAKVPDLAIDSVSMRSFLQEPLVDEIDKSVAARFGVGVEPTIPDRLVEGRGKSVILAGVTKLNDLRSLLERYKVAIPDFAEASKRIMLHPRQNPFAKGVSVYQLAALLVFSRGKEDALKFLAGLGVKSDNWDIDLHVSLAKEVMTKYSKEVPKL